MSAADCQTFGKGYKIVGGRVAVAPGCAKFTTPEEAQAAAQADRLKTLKQFQVPDWLK
jgi:hypothetical protein